jgi:4-hydroxy-2-oxoheptanedioate aldolase
MRETRAGRRRYALIDNTAKAKLKAGQAIIGPIVNFSSPQLVEIAGRAGFDFVFIDCEHGAIGLDECENLVRAADVVGLSTIVRVPENNPQQILRYLDLGAHGVQVPHLTTRDDALRAVDASKYQPQGSRGMGGGRSGDYGLGPLTGQALLAFANQHTWVSGMIEDQEGIRNLDQILTVDGLDIIAIGPNDLASSLGHPGNPGHPEVQKTIDEIVQQARAAGKAVGVGGNASAESVRRNIQRGATYLTLSYSGFIGQASRALLAQAREP